jgi:hypothetical protein
MRELSIVFGIVAVLTTAFGLHAGLVQHDVTAAAVGLGIGVAATLICAALAAGRNS